jgi:hypothetical protein
MNSRLFRSLIAVVSLAFVATAFAQDYAIKLSRPKKAGMKCHVTGRATEREEQALIVSGRTNHTENAYDLDFAADAEVLEVDPKGLVKKALFTLETCLKTSKQGREQLFPKGTVIVASSQEGKTVLSTKDGQPIPPAESKVLSAVISVHNEGPDDDEIFGTAARQKVGSSWPVNTDVALRDLEKKMPGMTLSAGKGSTRLVGITKVDGIDCLDLSAELRMQVSPQNPPPGLKIIQNELTAKIAGAFPVDTSRQPLTENMEMTVKLAMSGKFGPQNVDGVMRMTAYRKSELKYGFPAE